MTPPLSPRSANFINAVSDLKKSIEEASSIAPQIQNDVYQNIFSRILESYSRSLERMASVLEKRGDYAFSLFGIEALAAENELRIKIQEMKNTHLQKEDENKVQLVFDSFLQRFIPITAPFKITKSVPVAPPTENPDAIKAKQVVLRTLFEQTLERINTISDIHPECFISYSCKNLEDIHCIHQVARDLKRAGVQVLLDSWEIKAGDDIIQYIGKIRSSS